MYSKILIISDNIYLCSEFEKIIFSEGYNNKYYWDFSISPFSNLKDFKNIIKSKIHVFDLKSDNDINQIIDLYDLVISIHCKQIFPKKLIDNVKCINVHPGYNPINRGWYPQVFSIINETKIGATIHEIDEFLDHGLIIDREFVETEKYDTSLSLYNKIINLEILLLKKNLINILENNYNTIIPEYEGAVFLKKDFNNLCKLDLDEEMTMSKAIDRLRALTHGNNKNAYFIDSKTQKKVFIKIEFNYEN